MLTGDTSRNDDDIRTAECVLQAVVLGEVALDLRDGADVGEIGGDAWGVDDIVEGELVDERACLEEEGEGL